MAKGFGVCRDTRDTQQKTEVKEGSYWATEHSDTPVLYIPAKGLRNSEVEMEKTDAPTKRKLSWLQYCIRGEQST